MAKTNKNLATLKIVCVKCEKPFYLFQAKYKATPNDPLAQAKYCPLCDARFYFTDLLGVSEEI